MGLVYKSTTGDPPFLVQNDLYHTLSKNGVCHFFQYAVPPEIMVGIAPYLVHRGTLGAPSIFLLLTLV